MAIGRRLLAPVVELRENETRHRAHDVRLLVSRDDGVQHRPADHALAVHQLARRRQPALRPAGRRSSSSASSCRATAGSAGCCPGRWVVPVTQAAMVGAAGVLLDRLPDRAGHRSTSRFYLFGQILRDSAHQPVLDAGQHHLRPAPGEAPLRVHRRRREPRRRRGRRITSQFVARDRQRQPDAGERRGPRPVRDLSCRSLRGTRSDDLAGLEQAGKEEGVSSGEAIQMLRRSRHLQIIAVVIAMTSIGAGLIDQQLNMATQAAKGREGRTP